MFMKKPLKLCGAIREFQHLRLTPSTVASAMYRPTVQGHITRPALSDKRVQ